jgi:hypothetical protein
MQRNPATTPAVVNAPGSPPRPLTQWLLVAALAAGVAAWQPAAAADECPAGEQYIACQAKTGDKLAIYLQGRAAYDAGRDSGDFTKALEIARSLARQNDKNGERLLKMVHLQLSWGGHRDLVQAYTWLSEDLSQGDDYTVPLRKQLAQKMSAEQLKQAKAKGSE